MSKTIHSVLSLALILGFSTTGFAKTQTTSSKENLLESTQGSLVEIANIQVFQEICPQLIGKNSHLDHGINSILANYLPGFDDPKLALQALNQEDYYQPILKQARQEVAQASQDDNRKVCLSIVNWDKSKK